MPELWVTRIPEIWNAAVKAQKVRQAGSAYAETSLEGWFVPDYVVERWREDSGPFLGFGAWTGASGGTFSIRRVELEATSEPAWAARLAVEELPDD